MKTIEAIVFVYLLCGMGFLARNYFMARSHGVSEEHLRPLFGPKQIAIGALLWLPVLLLLKSHRSFRDHTLRMTEDMIRGPSIEPMMPMRLPEACKHIDLRGFQAIWPTETPPEVKTATVLWCKSCGALSANDGETWEKPQDVLYLPMPPALKNLKSHEDVPS